MTAKKTNRSGDWQAYADTVDGDAIIVKRPNIERLAEVRRIVNCEPTMSNPAYGTPIQIGVTEVLECGHRIAQKKDIYGPTNANKRRCRKCAKLVADNMRPPTKTSRITHSTVGGSHERMVLRWGESDIAEAGKYDYRLIRQRTRTGRNSWDTQWSVVFTGGRPTVAIGRPGIGPQEIGRAWSKTDARKLAQAHWEAQNNAHERPAE